MTTFYLSISLSIALIAFCVGVLTRRFAETARDDWQSTVVVLLILATLLGCFSLLGIGLVRVLS